MNNQLENITTEALEILTAGALKELISRDVHRESALNNLAFFDPTGETEFTDDQEAQIRIAELEDYKADEYVRLLQDAVYLLEDSVSSYGAQGCTQDRG